MSVLTMLFYFNSFDYDINYYTCLDINTCFVYLYLIRLANTESENIYYFEILYLILKYKSSM